MRPELSQYMNYRTFLRDFYEYKLDQTKKDLRSYSYSLFSAAANIKSPHYLKLIIDGKRNLSDDMIAKFAKALNLDRERSDEFRLLVHFNQSIDPLERNVFLKKLSNLRLQIQLKNGALDPKIWKKISNWINWVLYAMLDQQGVDFDPKRLYKALRGMAPPEEIEEALNGLLSSGEILKDPQTGLFKKARSLMESAEDIPVELIRKIQSELVYLGLESLFKDPPLEREFGTLTLTLTHQEFEEIKFKLRQLRKQINRDISIRRLSSQGDRVYQLNLQLFPVTDSVRSHTDQTNLGADQAHLNEGNEQIPTGANGRKNLEGVL